MRAVAMRRTADVDEQVVAPPGRPRGKPAAAARAVAPVRPRLVDPVPERRGVAARAREPLRLAAVLRERADRRRDARRARALALAVRGALERVKRAVAVAVAIAAAGRRRERRGERGLVPRGGDAVRVGSVPAVGVVRDVLQAVCAWEGGRVGVVRGRRGEVGGRGAGARAEGVEVVERARERHGGGVS